MTGQITSEEILESILAESLWSIETNVDEVAFMEDLDPKHWLRIKISYRKAEDIGYNITQYYPLSSPDLNLIK